MTSIFFERMSTNKIRELDVIGILRKYALAFISMVARSRAFSRIIFFTVALDLHIVLSLYFRNFSWLASFGGLLIVFGILIIFEYSLPENQPLEYKPELPIFKSRGVTYFQPETGLAEIVPENAVKDIEAFYNEKVEEHAEYILEKRNNISINLIVTIIGTLVASYAANLNFLFEAGN